MIFRRLFLVALAFSSLLLAYSYWEAVSTPLVRRTQISLPGWPVGAPPMKAVLISDIHVAGPDMPPARLTRIVRQINSLAPDLVLIAGDLVSDKGASTRHYSLLEATAPLAELKAKFGVIAVLGNHDHWRNTAEARAGLAAARVTLLDNEVARAGPLVIGGLDDDFTGRDDLSGTLDKMRWLKGGRLILSHSPDPFADLSDDVSLMLAGHTHCGQVAPPPFGITRTMSRYGKRYACGIVREGGKTLIVTAGLGTSGVPLRLNAPPDMWVIELGPPR